MAEQTAGGGRKKKCFTSRNIYSVEELETQPGTTQSQAHHNIDRLHEEGGQKEALIDKAICLQRPRRCRDTTVVPSTHLTLARGLWTKQGHYKPEATIVSEPSWSNLSTGNHHSTVHWDLKRRAVGWGWVVITATLSPPEWFLAAWAAVPSHFNISLTDCEGQSHMTVSINYNL